MNPEKIEQALDRVAAGATTIDMNLGGVRFQSMMELMEFSKLMSLSQLAVPVHLRNNPGACLAVCTKALRFGFDPFALAEHSFAMVKNIKNGNNWESVETIAYDSAVIRAVINAHAPLKEPITYRFEGEGDDRVCIAVAKPIRGDAIEWKSAKLGDKLKAMPRNDKGQIKGSPLWESPKVDVQFAYDTGRDLCRVHFPETLMGWYDKDEFDEAARARDVTPAKPPISSRLKGNTGAGFNAEHVNRETGGPAAIEHQPEIQVGAIDTSKSDVAVKIDKSTGEITEAKPKGKIKPTNLPKPEEARDQLLHDIAMESSMAGMENWQAANHQAITGLPAPYDAEVREALRAKLAELEPL